MASRSRRTRGRPSSTPRSTRASSSRICASIPIWRRSAVAVCAWCASTDPMSPCAPARPRWLTAWWSTPPRRAPSACARRPWNSSWPRTPPIAPAVPSTAPASCSPCTSTWASRPRSGALRAASCRPTSPTPSSPICSPVASVAAAACAPATTCAASACLATSTPRRASASAPTGSCRSKRRAAASAAPASRCAPPVPSSTCCARHQLARAVPMQSCPVAVPARHISTSPITYAASARASGARQPPSCARRCPSPRLWAPSAPTTASRPASTTSSTKRPCRCAASSARQPCATTVRGKNSYVTSLSPARR